MKNFLLLLALTVSAHSFAGKVIMEFDQDEEIQCLKEVKTIGCEGESEAKMMDCVEANKKKLSKTCQDMHTAKSQN